VLKLKGIDGDLNKRWSMWFKFDITRKTLPVLVTDFGVLKNIFQKFIFEFIKLEEGKN